MTKSVIELNIFPLEILEICNHELDLVPYIINIILTEHGIPANLNYINIIDNTVSVSSGLLSIRQNNLSLNFKWENK